MRSLVTDRLPVRLTPLVGRQRELQDVVDSLSRSRLLTLTGPGGIGKTRLALAAAGALSVSYPEGVCWVELAPLDDPGVVAQVVARRLGVPDCPGRDAVAAIAEQVGGRSMLIVLDNCEHLAFSVADLAEQLLGVCPAMSILATSREVLGVDGERSWPVPPLSLPEAGAPAGATALKESDAVRFFEYRAQHPWARDPGGDTDGVADALIRLMDLRLPLSVRIRGVVPGEGLALVVGERHIIGTGPDCERIKLIGAGATVVRRQQGGSWRIAADAW